VYRKGSKEADDVPGLIWFTKDGTITRRIDGALASNAWSCRLERCPSSSPLRFRCRWDRSALHGLAIKSRLRDVGPNVSRRPVLEEIPAVAPALLIAAVWTALAIWLYNSAHGQIRRAAPGGVVAVIGLLGLVRLLWLRLRRRLAGATQVSVVRRTCAARSRPLRFSAAGCFPLPSPKRAGDLRLICAVSAA